MCVRYSLFIYHDRHNGRVKVSVGNLIYTFSLRQMSIISRIFRYFQLNIDIFEKLLFTFNSKINRLFIFSSTDMQITLCTAVENDNYACKFEIALFLCL